MKKQNRKFKSIVEEKRDCIAAFKKYPTATQAWCIHHAKLVEEIEGTRLVRRIPVGIFDRIHFISVDKPQKERACRFRNMRPVKPGKGRMTIARFKREWPHNTWTKGTIFPYDQ